MAPMDIENLITDYLDLWTAAVRPKSSAGRGSNSKLELAGIKKLRELILELAVRGKLVPQDPNDEPASVLLKNIAAEKARLLKAGKIKNPKALPEISEEEKPFELPEGWEWARFQDVTTYIQRGKGPVYAEVGSIRVVSQKCIQWSGFDLAPAKFIDDVSIGGYARERFLIANDLLWNSTGTGTVGRVNVIGDFGDVQIVADSHVTVIRPETINSNFMWCYIASQSIQSRISPDHAQSLVSGSTKQVELNTSAVIALEVPIPPLPEQERIIARVDEMMALCDQLEQQSEAQLAAHQTLVEVMLATLTDSIDADELAQNWARLAQHFDTLFITEASIDALKQTILQLAVMGKLVPQDPTEEPASALLARITAEKARLVKEKKIKAQKLLPPIAEDEKPFSLPQGWEWVRLQQVVTILGDGLHGTPNYDSNGEYFFVNGNNLENGRILIKPDTKRVNKSEFEKYQKPLTDRTILVSINGTLGKVGFYSDEKIVLGKSACYFNLSELLSKPYIKRVIESSYFVDYAFSKATGSTIKNLGLKAMNEFSIALPPVEEMNRIVAKIDQLMAICDQLKASLQTSQQTQLALAESLVEGALA